MIPTAALTIVYEDRRIDLLRECLESTLARTTLRSIEPIVVHNRDLPAELKEHLESRVRLVAYDRADFNLAARINLDVSQSRDGHAVRLNDNTQIITPGWIEIMLQYAQQPEIGAVGPKLLFPNGRIQHAGIGLLNGRASHAYYNRPGDDPGYYLSTQVVRNYVAVGACLMTRRVFAQAGGFCEDLSLNYNDFDYCLKLRDFGYRTVFVPDAELYHYECVSREAGASVRDWEWGRFQCKWKDKYFTDPYYNSNLPTRHPYYYAD